MDERIIFIKCLNNIRNYSRIHYACSFNFHIKIWKIMFCSCIRWDWNPQLYILIYYGFCSGLHLFWREISLINVKTILICGHKNRYLKIFVRNYVGLLNQYLLILLQPPAFSLTVYLARLPIPDTVSFQFREHYRRGRGRIARARYSENFLSDCVSY